MKASIHPTWFHDCQVTCSCGNKFVIGSTQETLQVDICDKCHPFFTGEVKFVDRQGRVDKFIKKQKDAEGKKAQLQSKKKKNKDENVEAKTYRELLREQQANLRSEAKNKTTAEEKTVKSN